MQRGKINLPNGRYLEKVRNQICNQLVVALGPVLFFLCHIDPSLCMVLKFSHKYVSTTVFSLAAVSSAPSFFDCFYPPTDVHALRLLLSSWVTFFSHIHLIDSFKGI